MVNNKMLEILICPICHGPLHFNQDKEELLCHLDRLAFPIIDDIPLMLVEESRKLASDEI